VFLEVRHFRFYLFCIFTVLMLNHIIICSHMFKTIV
jgi:hypothetical protein